MRIILIYYLLEDRGSAQDIKGYIDSAKKMGHEIVVYGRSDFRSSFHYSQTINKNDAVVFIFEWTTELLRGGFLDYIRLISKIPRERRVLIDCDGKYNNPINFRGDINHKSKKESLDWINFCNSLTDKIFQPTIKPLKKNVGTFFFHAYNPNWETNNNNKKKYGMCYVGNNWYRWDPMYKVLKKIKKNKGDVGRISITGHGWDRSAPWASKDTPKEAYKYDYKFIKSLDIDVFPPIKFSEVIKQMNKGVFNPVIYRPLFDKLNFVTCRTYETFAANTIPLFTYKNKSHLSIYGENETDVFLIGKNPQKKILDVMKNQEKYIKIARNVRSKLKNEHSHDVRLKELINIINS